MQVNLEVLDVSRNKLTYISGLENNFRMKRLYLNVRAPLSLLKAVQKASLGRLRLRRRLS